MLQPRSAAGCTAVALPHHPLRLGTALTFRDAAAPVRELPLEEPPSLTQPSCQTAGRGQTVILDITQMPFWFNAREASDSLHCRCPAVGLAQCHTVAGGVGQE